jgi:hypothetical protein
VQSAARLLLVNGGRSSYNWGPHPVLGEKEFVAMPRYCCYLALVLSSFVASALAQEPPVELLPAPAGIPQVDRLRQVWNTAERNVLLNDLPPTAPGPKTIQAPPAAVVAEIMQIRKAQGDSSPESDAEFSAALKQVASEEAARDNTPQIMPPYSSRPQGTMEPLVQGLRQSARHLDSVAADYEERNEYELAEKSRELAASLRKEARQLQSKPTVRTY